MITEHGHGGRAAQLVELEVTDPPEAWSAAGFSVHDDVVDLGGVAIRLVDHEASADGPDSRRGIRGWTLAGLDLPAGTDPSSITDLDGLPTTVLDATHEPGPSPDHANGCTGLDHVVVATPDLERTIAALGQVGLTCLRIRETESYGSPMRQAFFRLGPTVLEVVSGDTGNGLPAAEAPSTWFGLAVDVTDLGETAELLGEGLGSIKTAVQDGRRIATFRHKVLGISVPIAAMDDHAGRETPDR